MIDTSNLLASTTSRLFHALEIVQVSVGLQPQKPHYAAHIQLLDFKFNRSTLVQTLTQLLVDWVFSRQRAQRIFDESYASSGLGAATASLYQAAKQTVRVSAPQGQFGELLLNGFLQALFGAVPLLRKQPIRTSDQLERFGADAIHFSGGTTPKLFLGESKCYKSSYQFPNAFSESLSSIMNTIDSFDSEIRKFSVGGFLEDDLEPVANDILQNKLPNLTIWPVALVIYNETGKLTKDSIVERKVEILNCLAKQCEKVQANCYSSIDAIALSRITYILMPVWELDKLLDDFVLAL